MSCSVELDITNIQLFLVMQNNLKVISTRFNLLKQQLPKYAGNIAVNFTKSRFREQAWIDSYMQPWKRRKSNGKKDRGRAILVKSGRMRRSPRVIRTGNMSVTIGSDVPYYKVHNDGFRGIVTVKVHRRKKFKKSQVETTKLTKKGKPRKKQVITIVGEINVKSHQRRMNIPRRRSMGVSAYQTQAINRMISAEIKKIFKK